VETIASWGPVVVGHSSPTQSAAGLEAVYLLAYDFLLPPSARPTIPIIAVSDGFGEGPIHSSAHLTDALLAAIAAEEEPLRRWLARCEGGLEGDPHSAQLLTETMFHVGDERYDGVATHEHLVFPILDRLEGNAAVMEQRDRSSTRPSRSSVEHPALLLADATDDPADGPSADRSPPVAGVPPRAGDPAAGDRARVPPGRPRREDPRAPQSTANPFLRFRRYGVQFTNPLVEPPRLGRRARSTCCSRLWRDATGRN
jgi:hypothetical protein